MQATSISVKAQEVYDAFELATRTDGESTFYRIKDGSPEWIRDLARDAHGTSIFPDDYRYEWIMDAAGAIADFEPGDLYDFAHDWAENGVDVYTAGLTAWLASHLSRVGYCDQFIEELGADGLDTFRLLSGGQYMERMEIFQGVRDALESL